MIAIPMIALPMKIRLKLKGQKTSIRKGELCINMTAKYSRCSQSLTFLVASWNCLVLSIKTLIK